MQDHAFTLYSKKKHELALQEHVAAGAKKKGNHKSRWPKLDQTVAKRGAQARPHRAPHPRRARAMPPPKAASRVAARAERPPPARAQRTLPPPLPPPRTKWTRRVPHPVLIGHAASLSQAAADARLALRAEM